jgi:uncharacterized protein YjbI with pentapeptide repeats
MANPEHLAVLKQGAAAWGEYREKRRLEVFSDQNRRDSWDDVKAGHKELGGDFRNADLRDAKLSDFVLEYADFSGAMLDGASFFKADLICATFSQASLRGAVLTGGLLVEADLTDAILNKAIIQGADLTEANLRDARLVGSNLAYSNLEGALLDGADLRGSDLTYCRIGAVSAVGANFARAQMGRSVLANCDLRKAIGLDRVKHTAPSTVGIDTILRSTRSLSRKFLLAAGIPRKFLSQVLPSVSRGIRFFSCFLSHSTKDMLFVSKLYRDLRAKGVQAWFFPESAKLGRRVWSEIEIGLRSHDKVVVVCSKNSLNSGPVLREIERALNREDKEKAEVLFPIRIDNYLFDGWSHPRKTDIVDRVVGDFTGWKRDEARYRKSLTRLVKALRA